MHIKKCVDLHMSYNLSPLFFWTWNYLILSLQTSSEKQFQVLCLLFVFTFLKKNLLFIIVNIDDDLWKRINKKT